MALSLGTGQGFRATGRTGQTPSQNEQGRHAPVMTDAQDAPPSTGPYAAAAATYWAAGWRGVLPLPPRRKGPVPTGWTGTDGAWPSFADIHAWTEDHPDGNLALRLPPGVIGIDVDQYGAKPGYMVMQDFEAKLGALPATWRSTSRDDGMSGIRLYRIPEGLRWPGVLGPGIEVLRTGHRYAVAWPSIHPDTGGTYRWITPAGAIALEVVPSVDELPDLPDTWVEHFTHGELASEQPRASLSAGAAGQWVAKRGGGVECRHMASALERAMSDLKAATSRHDTALSAINRIVWLAGEGHVGATSALGTLRYAFLMALIGSRAEGDAEAEWDRMVAGAVRIAAAAHADPNPDPCDNPFHGLIESRTIPADIQAAAAELGINLSPAELDDATEIKIKRNQAAAQELERLRAQRAAQRMLEQEDEEHAIADRVRRRILDDKAATEYKRQTQPAAPPFDAGSLADILARPADPPMRAAGLIPWSGSALVVAQRKTGKTTLLLNYARALITGEKFLGEYDVIALPSDARVAFMNYEVSAAQLARWAADTGVPDDRLYLVNLRGRRNPLGHDDDRAALAAQLRAQNVHAVIVDPFGRAYTGVSQNDNGEVQAFLVGLEEFVRSDVGALDLMLATHAGWDGERTRGASALEDWGDVIITMTRDADDESRRYMKAMGRDVDVDEDEIAMDPLTRSLTRTGNGSRTGQKKDRKIADLSVLVVRAAGQQPGISYNQAETIVRAYGEMTFRKGDAAKAAHHAQEKGLLTIGTGPRGAAALYAITPEGAPHRSTSPTSPDLPRGKSSTSPPPFMGEVGGETGIRDLTSPTSYTRVDKTTGEVS